MPKKILNSIKTAEPANAVKPGKPAVNKSELKALMFSPSEAQSRAKSRFWSRYQSGPLAPSADDISALQAAQIIGSSAVESWWTDKGFRDWFLNKDEEREKIKHLFNKSLNELDGIVSDPAVSPAVKVNAIKLLADLNGNTKKTERPVEFADAQINNMTEEQLYQFLKRFGVEIDEKEK